MSVRILQGDCNMSDTPRTDEARNYKADVVARNARLIDLAETLEREHKELHNEIVRLYERIDVQSASVLRFNRETNEMSRRAITAEDERDVLLADLTKIKDDFDEAIKQRDKWRDEAYELNLRIGRIMKDRETNE